MNDAVYGHQYIYIPWSKNGSHSAASIAATKLIAAKHRLPITVVAGTLQSVPDEFSRAAKVTERSGSVKAGGVVLAYYPTNKLMSKIDQLSNSIVILAEWHQDNHSGWAKSVGAYNLVTDEMMTEGLSAAGNEAIDALLSAGYKGWHDAIAVRQARDALDELLQSGGYDRHVVLFRARKSRGESGISKLYSILDQFETKNTIEADGSRRAE